MLREISRVKIKIPDEMKASLPATRWGKLIGATPVVMTVIATLLAGLANSEMTKAQYDRSLAAQLQSKAADQWAFFQAKRVRGAVQSGTLDVVQLTGMDNRIDADGLRALAATMAEPEKVQSALGFLLSGKLPESAPPPKLDPRVQEALAAMERSAPNAELASLLRSATPELLGAAVRAAEDHAKGFDGLLRPIVTHGDRLGDLLDPMTAAPANQKLVRSFAQLRLRYSSQRYDAEAALNQRIAVLRELQVRQMNFSAERHHQRSQRFFYGMLAAQAAVIISTFAMAAHQRNLLWSLAASAGMAAILFAGYVYLYI